MTDGRLAKLTTALALVSAAALAVWQNVLFKPWAGTGDGPDAKFGGYDLAWFKGWMDQLHPAARDAYLLWHTRVFDMAFPLFLAAALIALTLAALRRHPWMAGATEARLVIVAAVLPVSLFMLDYLENTGVGLLVSGRIGLVGSAVALVSAVSGAKWLFGLFAVALPVGLWLSSMNRNRNDG